MPEPTHASAPQPNDAYATWRAALPDDDRALLDDHTAELEEAFEREQHERATLATHLQEMEGDGNADPATEAHQEALEALQAELRAAQSDLAASRVMARAMEEALRPDVRCAHPRLALLAAQDSDLIDEEGAIDWQGLRALYPPLFVRPTAHVGEGAGALAPAAADMNAFIRRAAARP